MLEALNAIRIVIAGVFGESSLPLTWSHDISCSEPPGRLAGEEGFPRIVWVERRIILDRQKVRPKMVGRRDWGRFGMAEPLALSVRTDSGYQVVSSRTAPIPFWLASMWRPFCLSRTKPLCGDSPFHLHDLGRGEREAAHSVAEHDILCGRVNKIRWLTGRADD